MTNMIAKFWGNNGQIVSEWYKLLMHCTYGNFTLIDMLLFISYDHK